MIRLIEMLAPEYNTTLELLLSDNRSKYASRPRQIIMYVLSQATQESLLAIANVFARRDHSCVVNAIKRVEQMMKKSASLRVQIEADVQRSKSLVKLLREVAA